jgi:hypothetical protein
MAGLKITVLVVAVIILAGATIWMAHSATDVGMPIWAAALGPVLLALTLIVHLKGRRK